MSLCHLMVDKPQKGVRGGIRKAFVLDESCKVAAVFHLVLKSNNFEKIKYTQKKETLRIVLYKKTHADPLRLFRNF